MLQLICLCCYRKTWQIFSAEVDVETGREVLTELAADQVAPSSHLLAELTVKPRMLLYGIYKVSKELLLPLIV